MVSTPNIDYEMFDLFEMTPDLVCIAGKDGYFRKVNPAVIVKLGYTIDELFSRPIASFIHPEDKAITSEERNMLLKGKPLLNFQNRYVTKKGDSVWLEWTSVYLPDKEIVFAIAKDITESKRREKEIEEMYNRYKNLAIHFKSHIEDDRKYLAHELHEELAQLAAVVKMNIAWIHQRPDGLAGDAKEKIDNAVVLSDRLVRMIRRLSFTISPKMLEDLGFIATLEWECSEFSYLSKIPCSFSSNCDDDDMSGEVKIDFFRICQEALSNVMEHAEAKNVKINLNDNGETIILSIADDGKGFDIKSYKQSAGLQNMQLRALSINGCLTIQSEPGKGTTITVEAKKHSFH